jgi:hypothetical protein
MSDFYFPAYNLMVPNLALVVQRVLLERPLVATILTSNT